jgi:hypothetical protein
MLCMLLLSFVNYVSYALFNFVNYVFNASV